MSKLQIYIVIALAAIIVIVVIIKAVQKSSDTRQAAAAAQNQTTLALAALTYKQNADNIAAAEHGTAYEWFESMNNAVEGFGGVWGSFAGGGGN